jgi:DNA-directed RNA polymerase subunit RPC12/RpoP
MNRDEALDTLVRHSQFFEIYAKELFIPRGCEGIMAEITEAYKVINTGYVCTSCGNEMIIDANRYRLHRMKELEDLKLKHYTFPKHD